MPGEPQPEALAQAARTGGAGAGEERLGVDHLESVGEGAIGRSKRLDPGGDGGLVGVVDEDNDPPDARGVEEAGERGRLQPQRGGARAGRRR